jgi:cysteine synthase
MTKLNIPLISAFNDEKIMAANGGTLAVEVLSQVPDAAHFVIPMGGGGLSAGFAWHVKDKNPHARTTICQLEGCPALQQSLQQNKPMTYTVSDSKIGKWQGGALNLSQAQPTPKQLNLKGWAMQVGLKFSGYPTQPEPILESRAV